MHFCKHGHWYDTCDQKYMYQLLHLGQFLGNIMGQVCEISCGTGHLNAVTCSSS